MSKLERTPVAPHVATLVAAILLPLTVGLPIAAIIITSIASGNWAGVVVGVILLVVINRIFASRGMPLREVVLSIPLGVRQLRDAIATRKAESSVQK